MPPEFPVNTSINTATRVRKWLLGFFVREDAVYEHYQSTYQARTAPAKILYLFLYLLPGFVAFACINVQPIFRAEMALTGLSAKYLQYAWVLIITFGWHMFVPFVILKFSDKLSPREILAFLGLNRVDWRGLFLVLPVFFILFAVISIPYIKFVVPIIEGWTQAIPFFRIPGYSIFQDTPENLYSFPPLALLILGIGNFFGEEIYFRGYLMKKTAFLGKINWIVNSVLFALYHLWQVQQTWPMIGLVLAFGLLMALRKDIYVLIAFHFLANMWMAYAPI
jgi:membrane protease YdiL (CAAX protease family)